MHLLTKAKIRNFTAVGNYSDGGGLFVQAWGGPPKILGRRRRDDTGKSWVFKYRFAGRQRLMGLGSLKNVSLDEARELAADCRKLVRAGKDPIVERDREKNKAAVSHRPPCRDLTTLGGADVAPSTQ
jgi:hypothetical protein